MTTDQHRHRHRLLHACLDELVADWLTAQPKGRRQTLSVASILDLVIWSQRQTEAPDHPAPEEPPDVRT
jgi:hypothetical protein